MLAFAYVLTGWLGFNLLVAALLVWRAVPPKQYRHNYQRIRLHAVPVRVTSSHHPRRA